MSAIDPALAAAFDAATQAGRLIIRRCRACDAKLPPDRALCPQCWSHDLESIDARGTGTLYSRVIFHRAFAQRPPVPYAVGQIELDEGVRVIGLVAPDLVPGSVVRAVLDAGQDGVTLHFMPTEGTR